MADYYSILKKTIGSLPENNGAARRSVYSRARNAIVNQLKAYEPPLSPSEITAEQLRLEEAIRKVEAEAARESLGLAPQSKPAEPKTPAPEPAVDPKAEAPVADAEPVVSQAASAAAKPEAPDTSTGAHAAEPGRVEPAASEVPSPLKQAVEEAGSLGEASHKAVQSTRDAMADDDAEGAERQEPVFGKGEEPAGGADDDDLFAPRSDEPGDQGGVDKKSRRRERGSASAALRANDGKFPVVPVALVGLLVLIAVGIAAVVYSQKDMVTEIVSDSEPAPEETVTPAPQDVLPKKVETATDTDEETAADAGKIEDRLLDDNGDPAAASDARSVTTTLITPNVSQPQPEEAAPQVAPAPSEPVESSTPSEESLISSVEPESAAPQATESDTSEASQRSILYEEGENAAGAGTASQGQVVWAVEEETDLDGNNQSILTMSVDIPERDVSVDIRIKPNSDASLPASHLVEIKYNFPSDFAAGDVVNVPGLVMKPTEEARGDALIGASVKVSPGYFWIALSNINSETERNIGLLRERGWIDIPMLYENGKRGILTLEKGQTGAQAVEKAISAWLAG
ncbi:hypothetical protein [Roseibium sp.]|uniref:hypothetical protein n=1 Tax=Roseibium sp. TaxID=1936156 RepID=UPI003A97B63D